MRRNAEAAGSERAPRRFWFDARFGIGIGLVIASVLGTVALVTTADRTAAVWAARSALTPGDTVDSDDLILRDVRLAEAGDLYLPADALPSRGVVVTRAVAAGELVPASAVGSPDGLRVASVVVAAQGQLPRGVSAGAVVDLWSAEQLATDSFGAPSVLVSSATVVQLVENEGLIVDGSAVGVELLVPRSKIAAVLASIANDDAMSLVPVSMPVGTAQGDER